MTIKTTITKHRAIEFKSVGALNDWLERLGDFDIKKIFRSPDGVYFVWYSYEEKPIPK